MMISIHKALASLDVPFSISPSILSKFQSTRLSRASTKAQDKYRGKSIFQSTRLSRASTWYECNIPASRAHFNPQGSREPRQQNYPTIPPHPPNFLCIMSSPPYFNLLHPFTQPIFTAFPLFFRCESPRHFMLAWHSHLV